MSKPHLDQALFGDPTTHEHAVVTRRSRRRRPSRARRAVKLIVLVLALALVVGAGYAAYGVLRPVVSGLTASNDYEGPGTGEVRVTVNEGDSGRAIAATLEKAGVVKTSKAFVDAAAEDPRAASIQPGTYTLRKQMSARGALAALAEGGTRAGVPRVTIPEGLWTQEVFERLSTSTGVPLADYQAAAKDPQALGLPSSAKGNLEGYLFPSTYEFAAKAPAAQQLKTMVAKAVEELTKAGVAEADMERTMIVASIVEGEVNGDADRAKVARVIENRLRTTGPPNYGLLQMDSTVHYAVKKRGRAGTSDADRQSPSPYNTYRVQGLPPGPINNPGAASIEAAANPAEGPWLFFVTVDPSTGETRFAATEREHQANVSLFNQWCRDNPGKC
jgi:UPF0755 protein